MEQSILNQNMNSQGQASSKRMIERIRNVSSSLIGPEFPMSESPQAFKKRRRPRRPRDNYASGNTILYQHQICPQPMRQCWVSPQQIMPFFQPAQQQFLTGPPLAYEYNELLSQNVSVQQNQVWPSPIAYPSSVHQPYQNSIGTTKTRKRPKKTNRSKRGVKNSPWKCSPNRRNKQNIKQRMSFHGNKTSEDEMQSTIISEKNTAESHAKNFGIGNDVEEEISDVEYRDDFSDPEHLISTIRESYATESWLETSEGGQNMQFKRGEEARIHLVRLLFGTECPTLDLAIAENQQEDKLVKLKKLTELKGALLQFQDVIEETLKELMSEKLKFHEALEAKLNELV